MSDQKTAETTTPDVAPDSPEGRLAAAEAEIARLKDELLRAVAEQDNIRKRGERSLSEARLFAIDRFARDLLPVADNFARAMEIQSDAAAATLREGVTMTFQTLTDVFARHGLKQVGAKGDKFDPNLHQAIAQIPSEHPAGAIAEVMQPGWVLADRTLRAAMVAVSVGAAPAAAPAPSEPPAAEPGATIDVSA